MTPIIISLTQKEFDQLKQQKRIYLDNSTAIVPPDVNETPREWLLAQISTVWGTDQLYIAALRMAEKMDQSVICEIFREDMKKHGFKIGD